MMHADTARELYRAFGQRKFDEIVAILTEDVEWGEPDNPYNPTGGTRYGHAGFLEWLKIGNEAEDILVLEPRTFIAQGDLVAVVGYLECRAKATGRTYASDFVHVLTFREDKICRFREFFDTYAAGDAFQSAGAAKSFTRR
jgi:ketosteroid isomerase-like protein